MLCNTRLWLPIMMPLRRSWRRSIPWGNGNRKKSLRNATWHYQTVGFRITLKFLIRVLHILFFFRIFSYIHGLIRTYLHVWFLGKSSHLQLHYLIKTCTLIYEKTSHLHDYQDPTLIRNSGVKLLLLNFFPFHNTYFFLCYVLALNLKIYIGDCGACPFRRDGNRNKKLIK